MADDIPQADIPPPDLRAQADLRSPDTATVRAPAAESAGADRRPLSGGARSFAAAATLIAALTVVSRLVGFGRTVVFTQSVGFTGLGDVYLAANTIPNVVFEIVAGGALAGLVVPLLAGPIAAGDRLSVSRTVSALLTWALSALVPLAGLVALAADPIMGVLGPTLSPVEHDAAVTMLRVFAPQVPLYGVGIVLAGVLQAHRRFAWPVLAPLLSSITVIATYLLFAARAGAQPALSAVSSQDLLVLAGGTTLGVVVLSLCLLLPLRGLGLRLRPGYRMAAAGRRASGLVLAGTATVSAQQIALVVAVRLALEVGEGTNTVYNVAWTVFLLPWSVLAVPLATAAYPGVATAHATGDRLSLTATVARTGQAVALVSALGAAGLAAIATPVANLFTSYGPHAGVADEALAGALLAFAPGLLGYGLAALHQRTLYAVGAHRSAALAIAAGWAVTVAAAVVASTVLAADQRAMALALATSAGTTVMAVGLAWAVRRACGRPAIAGLRRSVLVGILGALLAAAAGRVAGSLFTDPGGSALLGQGMLSGGIAAIVFVIVCSLLAPQQLRPLWQRAVRLRRRRAVTADGRGDR